MGIFEKNKNEIVVEEVEELRSTPKMTMDEYINARDKYLKNQSGYNYKYILISLISLVGLVFLYFLFSLALKIFEINQYAGYVASFIALVFFILFYIVPVCKLTNLKKFNLEFGRNGAKDAKRRNKRICLEIRDRMIDIEENVYCDMNEIEYNALKNATEKDIESALYNAYNNSIKKKAKKVIGKYARKCALLTALSQDQNVDSVIIASLDIALIKELTYLYGFRPNDKKMTLIIFNVMKNVLVSMGLSDLTSIMGSGVAGLFSKAIPTFVGDIIGKITESAGQGFVNGLLVNNIGKQTIKYLLNDYELQYKLSLVQLFGDKEEDNKVLELSDSEMKELNDSNKISVKNIKDECLDAIKEKANK